MAFERKRYPPDWPQVRARILQRANDRCEGTPQHPDCRAKNHERHPETGSKVVLTIAHMWDSDPANCYETNLRALCNRCHLSWDRPHHLRKQRLNREARKRRRQPLLPFEEVF
jgi:hypothetical protein